MSQENPPSRSRFNLSRPVRILLLIWLAWAVILIGFQDLADKRYQPKRPDYALDWTPNETARNSQQGKLYLTDPFMNHQVAWDSEYYLSIANVGYDDPEPHAIRTPDGRLSLNYAFFPFYPLLIRVVSAPLQLLGLTTVATATLAGVIVSLLGTLGAMLALYDLARDELDDSGGIRAAFYLIIFPTGFFLAQVYTEGLFVGLTFGALALMKRRNLLGAAILSALAFWTRPVGGVLIVPLALAWAREVPWQQLSRDAIPWKTLAKGLLVLTPLVAYFIWKQALGTQFEMVEKSFFSRGLLAIDRSLKVWSEAFASIGGKNPQMAAYYLIEFTVMGVALITSLFTLRRYPGVTLFGLGVFLVSFTSGVPQGMHRYVIAMPAMFICLGRWGKHPAFDRAWTLASVLVMGMLAALFAYDMWVG